ncbi:MAG: hypothetical protein SGARI_007188, partial [Bacillariaceae sp.]
MDFEGNGRYDRSDYLTRLENFATENSKLTERQIEDLERHGDSIPQAAEHNKIMLGFHFNVLAQFLTAVKEPFEGGYARMTGRINNDEWEETRPTPYKYLANTIPKAFQETATPALDLQSIHTYATMKSANGTVNGGSVEEGEDRAAEQANKARSHVFKRVRYTYGILGKMQGDRAHLSIPEGNGECAPLHAMYCPAVLGMDVDKLMRDIHGDDDPPSRENLIKAMQFMAVAKEMDSASLHSNPEGGRPIGLAEMPQNRMRAPIDGHEEFLDRLGA